MPSLRTLIDNKELQPGDIFKVRSPIKARSRHIYTPSYWPWVKYHMNLTREKQNKIRMQAIIDAFKTVPGYNHGFNFHADNRNRLIEILEENLDVEDYYTFFYNKYYRPTIPLDPDRNIYGILLGISNSMSRVYQYMWYPGYTGWNALYQPANSYYILREHTDSHVRTQACVFSMNQNVYMVKKPPMDIVKSLPYLLDDSLGKFLVRQAQRQREKREARALVKQRKSEGLSSSPSLGPN